ncbi:hypothetical protein GCM10027512_04560 [Chromohalobacter beijerinckii]|nr:lyase family protein [Chromohalobacter beijerinckii]
MSPEALMASRDEDFVGVILAFEQALAGAVDKLALDVSLLTQSEVAEVSEPAVPGAGGSSSMPHKRNPVICARFLAEVLGADAAQRVAKEAAETSRHERRDYADVLLADEEIARQVDAQRLRACVDPGLYIGSSPWQVQRVLDMFEAM